MSRFPMTDRGFIQLENELRRLRNEERPAISRELEVARAHGDLSENAEYHAAKERQGFVEARVAELEDKVSRAQVIDATKLSGGTVKFGATVTLIDDDTEAEVYFQIVGEDEADVKAKRLSIGSPLARALIGKEVGDEVEVTTPGGHKLYELIKIQFV